MCWVDVWLGVDQFDGFGVAELALEVSGVGESDLVAVVAPVFLDVGVVGVHCMSVCIGLCV